MEPAYGKLLYVNIYQVVDRLHNEGKLITVGSVFDELDADLDLDYMHYRNLRIRIRKNLNDMVGSGILLKRRKALETANVFYNVYTKI